MKPPCYAVFSFLLLCGVHATGQDINRISSLLQSFEKDMDFNGVVLLAKGDEVILQEGYGFLDKNKTIKTD